MDNEVTTIQVKKSTLEKLEAMKVHPRQPINEIIENLLNKTGDRNGNSRI